MTLNLLRHENCFVSSVLCTCSYFTFGRKDHSQWKSCLKNTVISQHLLIRRCYEYSTLCVGNVEDSNSSSQLCLLYVRCLQSNGCLDRYCKHDGQAAYLGKSMPWQRIISVIHAQGTGQPLFLYCSRGPGMLSHTSYTFCVYIQSVLTD